MSDDSTNNSPLVLGERIAELRHEAGMTQPELAVRAGISISTLYRAEQSHPSVGSRTVAKLASALSVAATEIYSGDAFVHEIPSQPVSAARAEEQHDEVISRLKHIQEAVDNGNHKY